MDQLSNAMKIIEKREKEISLILKATSAAQKQKDYQKAVEEIYNACKELNDAKHGFVALKKDSEHIFLVEDIGKKDFDIKISTLSPIKSLINAVYEKRYSLYENKLNSEDTLQPPEHFIGMYNILIAPIIIEDNLIGLFSFYNKKTGFNDRDVYWATAFSEIASIAINNHEMIDKIEKSEINLKKQAEELDDLVKEQTKLLVQKEIFTEIGHISSELAHDLRSPLQTIQNAAYLLELKPDRKELFSLIKESLSYATSILNSFREYYRGHEITPILVGLKEIVERSVHDVEIPENISVELKLAELGKITIDPTKIRRALNNLIKNAVEAMPEGGELTLVSKEEGEMVVIEVSDTGVGVPEVIRESLYQPFGSNKPGGSGLGLPSAKRIIESHGGKIEYDTVISKGTTFKITLPKKIEEF
jgi:signal transduction histidine kinase